ncbi:MAG TPA: dynamin family protein [Methanolinea sp.]|nr:dynamin family protein [Methanolinea sp.]
MQDPAQDITSVSPRNGDPAFPPAATPDLSSLLGRAISILHDLGPAMEPQERALSGLRDRLSEGRFQLAVLGQFKRGKSTLLNALLGEDILPSSVIPLTAIPTFIRHGTERTVKVHFLEQGKDGTIPCQSPEEMNRILLDYVSEEANPKNRKGVSSVEITHPSRILRDVVLIDTPGIGSTHRHNTEMTLNFLPQCDAALFLVSADPPITEVEVDFLRHVREKVACIFFVQNKVDYLTMPERETVIAFIRKVLSEKAGIAPEEKIFPVSAKQALLARLTGDETLLASSGISAITEHLVDFLAREKTRVLSEAVRRKALDVLHDASLRVSLERKSLGMPIADLEKKLSLFQNKVDEAERQRRQTQDVLSGDHRRVVALLEEVCAGIREQAEMHLQGVASRAMSTGGDPDPRNVEAAIAQEIPVYFEHTLGEVTERFDREMVAVLSAHREKAEALSESIRAAASTIFEIPHHRASPGGPLVLAREPYWVSRRTWSGMLGLISPDLVDRALPRAMREKRLRGRIAREIHSLVVQNVENLRWATLQNVDAAFRIFSREIDEELARTIDATHGAIAAAYRQRKERAEEIAERVRFLGEASRTLQELIAALSDTPG